MSTSEMTASSRYSFRTVLVLFFGAVVLVICSGLIIQRKLRERRVSEGRARSAENLRFLALAVQLYHGRYGCFPPPVVRRFNGDALYSGRVLLLPFLEQQKLYDAFNKNLAWDSYTNLPYTLQTPLFMRDRYSTSKDDGHTDYLFVVGNGTVFEPPLAGANATSMADGSANTLCVVEVKDSGINWAEPRDLDFSEAISLPPGNYRGINLAAFFDTHVAVIRNGLPPQSIRAAATCAGNEPLDSIPKNYIIHVRN